MHKLVEQIKARTKVIDLDNPNPPMLIQPPTTPKGVEVVKTTPDPTAPAIKWGPTLTPPTIK